MNSALLEGWENKSIGQCCDILDNQRIPLNSQERALRKGIYPYYGANGVQGYIDDYIFDGDAILLAEDGGNFEEYATRPIAQFVSGKFWVNNHAHILRAHDGLINKWVFYSLVHKNITEYINGGTRSKLNQGDLRNIEIPVPPLPEQEKIAAVLGAVDDVIEKTALQIKKLNDLKKSTMNELLTKGIGHTDFKPSELGQIPKSWEVVPLSDLLSFISYGFTNPMPSVDEGPTMVTAKDVQMGYINYESARKTTWESFKKLTEKSTPKMGDILVTKDGTLGRVAIVDKCDICINQSVAVLRTNGLASASFVAEMLSSPLFQTIMLNDAGGSTIKHIYITVIDKMMVLLPPIEEQNLIVNIIIALKNNINLKTAKLASLQSLKKSLMQDLLSGKVRVRV